MQDEPSVTAESILDDQEAAAAKLNPKKAIGKLADLLERNGIDVGDIAKVNRVNAWQGMFAKLVACEECNGVEPAPEEPKCSACGGTGKVRQPELVDMVGIQLVPNWQEGPTWPVVQPAKPTVVKSVPLVKRIDNGWRRAVILPDVQIGYRLLRDNIAESGFRLDPFHDERAMNVGLQVIREVRPDRIINLGDFEDFASFSKYPQEQSFHMTVQPGVDRGHLFLAEQRAQAPDSDIDVMEGNHDFRLPMLIRQNAASSFGLQRANLPESWPVMSVPHLLRFDELGVRYVAGYPANQIWINDNVRCIHGSRVKSKGSTAALIIDDERVSTIFGHIHRIELQHKTRQHRFGPKHNYTASPGCICRIDGAVPSTKGGIDLVGRPLVSWEDWQQGVAVVTYQEGDGMHSLEIVPIWDGVAFYRDKTFRAPESLESAA